MDFRNRAKHFVFDMWSSGCQVAVFESDEQKNGYAINFNQNGTIVMYKIENGANTQLWSK